MAGCLEREGGADRHLRGYGAIGSASDSRSEGWEFESLWPHNFFRPIHDLIRN